MVKLLYVVVTIVLTVLLARESEIIKGLDSNVKTYWLTFMVLIVPLSELNKIILDKVTTLPYLPLFVENILSSQVTIAVLVISDGLPDSKAQSLNGAKKLSGIINTLFIGRDDDAEAKAFMRELALLGCGRSRVCDISNPQMISSLKTSISLLLPTAG